MISEDVIRHITEHCGEEAVIRYEGLDDAIIGYANPWDTSGTQPTRIIYSYEKCVETLSKNMSEADAIEWMGYNVEGGYLGEHTPIIMYEGD